MVAVGGLIGYAISKSQDRTIGVDSTTPNTEHNDKEKTKEDTSASSSKKSTKTIQPGTTSTNAK